MFPSGTCLRLAFGVAAAAVCASSACATGTAEKVAEVGVAQTPVSSVRALTIDPAKGIVSATLHNSVGVHVALSSPAEDEPTEIAQQNEADAEPRLLTLSVAIHDPVHALAGNQVAQHVRELLWTAPATELWSTAEIVRMSASLGVQGSGREAGRTAIITLTCPPESLNGAAELVASVLAAPLVEHETFEAWRESRVELATLVLADFDTNVAALHASPAHVFAAGYPDPEQFEQLRAEDAQQLLRDSLRRSHIQVALAGAESANKVLPVLAQRFGTLPAPSLAPMPEHYSVCEPVGRIWDTDSSSPHAYAMIGVWLDRSSSVSHAAILAQVMASRAKDVLAKAWPAGKGRASLSVDLEATTEGEEPQLRVTRVRSRISRPVPLEVTAFVQPATVPDAFDGFVGVGFKAPVGAVDSTMASVEQSIASLPALSITPDELGSAAEDIRAQLEYRGRTPAGITETIALHAAAWGKPQTPASLAKQIDAVNPDEFASLLHLLDDPERAIRGIVLPANR